jgi:hypothetical protein
MDNSTTPDTTGDNSSAQGGGTATITDTTAGGMTTTSAPVTSATWKSSLRTDLRDSPLLSKFDDTPDGLNKAIESHANLEKLLGHEKVPIPKGENDIEGWNRFSKALGIPDKAQGYGLPDYQDLPEALKDNGLGKEKFAEIAHAHKLTPAQAKSLWKTYNDMNVESYSKAMTEHQTSVTNAINALKGEWGDAFQTNVELGQMVINKFAPDKEANDFITATLSKSSAGIKFLAKIGEQFAENKVGEFQSKRFTLAPEQAQEEIQKITRDPNHPYNNTKATDREHQAAVDYVNSLYAAINRARG